MAKKEADQLREWIRVAEEARATCSNVEAFDLLIQHQRQRLENLEKGEPKQTAVPAVEPSPGKTSPQQTATSKGNTTPVSKEEIIVFSSHCAYVRSVWLLALRLLRNRTDEKANLIRAMAPRVFDDLDQVFAEFIVVAAYRIIAPAIDARGDENLTVELILKNLPLDPETFKKLSHLDQNMEAFREKIETPRHKLGAHSDRATIASAEPLATASWEEWDRFWSDLREFVRVINEKILERPCDIDAGDIGKDAETLRKALKTYRDISAPPQPSIDRK